MKKLFLLVLLMGSSFSASAAPSVMGDTVESGFYGESLVIDEYEYMALGFMAAMATNERCSLPDMPSRQMADKMWHEIKYSSKQEDSRAMAAVSWLARNMICK